MLSSCTFVQADTRLFTSTLCDKKDQNDLVKGRTADRYCHVVNHKHLFLQVGISCMVRPQNLPFPSTRYSCVLEPPKCTYQMASKSVKLSKQSV